MFCTLLTMTHEDLINLWPTLKAFSEDIDVPYGTAKAMRRRKSIPASYWPVMVERSRARRIKGVTLQALADAVSPAREPAE